MVASGSEAGATVGEAQSPDPMRQRRARAGQNPKRDDAGTPARSIGLPESMPPPITCGDSGRTLLLRSGGAVSTSSAWSKR